MRPAVPEPELPRSSRLACGWFGGGAPMVLELRSGDPLAPKPTQYEARREDGAGLGMDSRSARCCWCCCCCSVTQYDMLRAFLLPLVEDRAVEEPETGCRTRSWDSRLPGPVEAPPMPPTRTDGLGRIADWYCLEAGGLTVRRR